MPGGCIPFLKLRLPWAKKSPILTKHSTISAGSTFTFSPQGERFPFQVGKAEFDAHG